MALTKSQQTVQASASNTAGSTTNSSAFAINYGVSGIATITNGGTGPTIGCTFNLQVSNDGGSTFPFTISSQTAGVTNSGVYTFPFTLGVGGAGGDWGHYRAQFTGNTGQTVTIQCDAETTTAL